MLFPKVLRCCFALLLFAPAAARAVNWLPFGPDGGDARRVAQDPKDHTHLFLGAANGWMYESHDLGDSWTRLARVDKRDDLVIDSIVVDSSDSKHLVVGAWVVTHTDGGVFTSHDGGRTWSPVADMKQQSVRALAQSRSDAKVLVAGTLSGVYRSDDGGVKWSEISPADSTEIHEVESVAIDPVDPKVIYAGTWHLPWKTTDGGTTWANIKDGIIDDSDVFSIIVDPKTPNIVYASACSGIYKSETAGELFHKIQGIPATARRTRVLMQDPQKLQIVFAGTTEGLFRSLDAGKTWSRTTGPEVIVNDVSVDSGNSQRVLLATERGGVLVSDDGGTTFHASNRGFSARQVTAMKVDAHRPGRVYAGVVNEKQWGGVFRSDDGGVVWTQVANGLEGRDVFSLTQAADGTMVAGTSHGLFLLNGEAELWSRVTDAPGEPAAVVEPAKAELPPTRPSVPVGRNAYAKQAKGKSASARRVKVTPVPKQEPPKASPSVFDGPVLALTAVDGHVLAATLQGLMTSANDGVSWTVGGPKRSNEWRLLASTRRNVVAASLRTIDFSADAGATWTPIAPPPELSKIDAVAVEPSGEIWAGGREGVYFSSDAGTTWAMAKNLFLQGVDGLYYDEAANRVLVTTGGYTTLMFMVQLPQKHVTFTDTGWNLRFARPMGDHMVGATQYDGVVVQPRMVDSPVVTATKEASK